MMLIALSTMLLNTACSSEDDLVNNTANTENTINKGYAMPVTVNVTREGDAGTRATYNESTRKLEFSAGDQLWFRGVNDGGAGVFTALLTWQSGGKFSGNLYTQNEYKGTVDALLTVATDLQAYLLPAGYSTYGFLSFYEDLVESHNAILAFNDSKAFALTKAEAVEQFTLERATSYSGGFALSPTNPILSFTITGLAASTVVAVNYKSPYAGINQNVTTDASGKATFALAAAGCTNIDQITLTVGGNAITLGNSIKTLAAGKIYNITRNAIPGALIGKFSVSSTDKVYFSKGNLQYTKSTGIWSFMDHQYSTVETTSQAIGDDYASQDVVSLFGWGTSGWNNGNTYYQPYNTAYVSSSGSSKGYGYGPKNNSTYTYDLTGTYANADWGHNAISNGGNTADTWRTLTEDEWTYLFNTRSASTVNGTADARYAKAYLFGTTHGVIIFPDVYTHPAGVTAPTGINATSSTSWYGNKYTATDWAKMEAAGCVFLPAAGWRDATTIRKVNEYVRYWTSSKYSSAGYARNVGIADTSMNPADYNQKNYGYSVRLVHDAN